MDGVKNNKGENITYNDLVVSPDIDYYIRTSKKDDEFLLVNFIKKKVENTSHTYIFKDTSTKKEHSRKNIKNIAIVKDTIANRKRRDDRDKRPPKLLSYIKISFHNL